MAGLWNLSQSQICDLNGKPYVGARAYFYQAGTTTPITVYNNYSLGSANALPNPLQADGFGRWPTVYLDEADGFYRVRVTTAQGVSVFDIDGIPIIGPTGGGGGGVTPVDPNAIYTTGDMMIRYGEGLRAGFVRANGRTIGSSTSGGSERANSDTQALFEQLWNADPTLAVLGGRGASSLFDWNANKQLTLPDARGRALAGMDTMGNVAAGILVPATTLGWKGGEQNHLMTVAEMPFHGHGVTDPGHFHAMGANVPILVGGSAVNLSGSTNSATLSNTQSAQTGIFIQGTGGGLSHNNVQPSIAMTIYIRL